MTYLIKSAVAKKYYESLNMEYDTEAARKKFNQSWIDIERLKNVVKEALNEELEAISQIIDEED